MVFFFLSKKKNNIFARFFLTVNFQYLMKYKFDLTCKEGIAVAEDYVSGDGNSSNASLKTTWLVQGNAVKSIKCRGINFYGKGRTIRTPGQRKEIPKLKVSALK